MCSTQAPAIGTRSNYEHPACCIKTHVLESIACDTSTGLFYSAGPHWKLSSPHLPQRKTGKGIWKGGKKNLNEVRRQILVMQNSWHRRSMHGYILTYSRLKRKNIVIALVSRMFESYVFFLLLLLLLLFLIMQDGRD